MQDVIQRNVSKYTLVINNFEGPLDLLLFLITKNKMTIFDISLSELTDKYIEYLNQMEELDLEITSEFIVMASTLLEIKARRLLPELEPEEDEDTLTEEDILNRIIEYKKYKEISGTIKQIYEENFGSFSKNPERIKFSKKIDEYTEKLDIERIYTIYQDVIKRNENKVNVKAKEIEKLALYEKITVKDKVKQIISFLNKNNQMIFNEVFNSDSCSNIEVVTAFLGLLELSKEKKVKVDQKYLFSDINVVKK
jgi:segregation and condensation protein A